MRSITIMLMATAMIALSSCGHSDELTPDIVTVTDEVISAPSAPSLTDQERDSIAAQQAEMDEVISNY